MILHEWRLQDIERAAHEAKNRLYELTALRSDVDRMEQTLRELRSDVNGLRASANAEQDRLTRLESAFSELAYTLQGKIA
jgi:predicted nuclease with TOPRIM domain